MAASIAVNAAIVAAARRRAELRRRQEQAYEIFRASDAFLKGAADAQAYIDNAYDGAALGLKTGVSTGLGFRSAWTLWLKKETPTAAQKDTAETAARSILSEHFLKAADNPGANAAWFAAVHPYEAGCESKDGAAAADGLDDETLYRIGFAARLGRTAQDLQYMETYGLTKGRANPERTFLAQTLAQWGEKISASLRQDARESPDALKARQSPAP